MGNFGLVVSRSQGSGVATFERNEPNRMIMDVKRVHKDKIFWKAVYRGITIFAAGVEETFFNSVDQTFWRAIHRGLTTIAAGIKTAYLDGVYHQVEDDEEYDEEWLQGEPPMKNEQFMRGGKK